MPRTVGHFFDIAPMTRAQGGPIQGYLANPDFPASPNEEQTVYKVDRHDFSIRLAQLLNSFWLLSAGPYATPYGIDGDTRGNGQAVQISEAHGRAVRAFQVIQCHTIWLVFLIVASTFLMAACILSAVLRPRWNAVELSLNVSSMTRDTPYVNVPDGGSYLDGDERSRLLREYKVMFGDVAPQKEVGDLAVASCERFAGSGSVSEARRTRVYD
ncbi:hypothetical protein CLAFUR4_12331 [Fulvia fulva]|nr:hypothetical protein CLAFUR4_12331 [Fulvia fulva]WPV33201.1 hypothetical protein CLAFUW7_12333 [Fulvia fulva]